VTNGGGKINVARPNDRVVWPLIHIFEIDFRNTVFVIYIRLLKIESVVF